MEKNETENGQLQNHGLMQQADGFPRYRRIYDYLLQEISIGKLKPGDRMP
jgi:DNA-binding GntR family transcriptional regulator